MLPAVQMFTDVRCLAKAIRCVCEGQSLSPSPPSPSAPARVSRSSVNTREPGRMLVGPGQGGGAERLEGKHTDRLGQSARRAPAPQPWLQAQPHSGGPWKKEPFPVERPPEEHALPPPEAGEAAMKPWSPQSCLHTMGLSLGKQECDFTCGLAIAGHLGI